MKTKHEPKISPEEIQEIWNDVKDTVYIGMYSRIVSFEAFAKAHNYDAHHAHSILCSLRVFDSTGRPTAQYDQGGFFEPVLVQFSADSDLKPVYRHVSYLTLRGMQFLNILLGRVYC